MYMTRTKRVGTAVIVLVAMTAVFTVAMMSSHASTRVHETTTITTRSTQSSGTASALARPPRLSKPGLSITAPPFRVPVVVEIPSIHVSSPMLSVGMTAQHAMAAPEGGANSPYWGETFWYRGSSVPGAVGTATIAGHIDDVFGRYAVFGHLADLVPGNVILIHFTNTGPTERFSVTRVHAYTLAETTTKAVLDVIYGTGPPSGRAPAPSKDGLAHLTLISCTGTWNYSLRTHNERLVVTAVRVR